MDKSYNRQKAMKQAKVEACGTKEPGLHPVVKKGPKELQPSDRRILLEKLCNIYRLPPHELCAIFWRNQTFEEKKLEKEHGHPIKYLRDWCGFTEYDKKWRETKREFVRKHYKGK